MLPRDCWVLIMTFLGECDFVRLCLTCKEILGIGKHIAKRLWMPKIILEYDSFTVEKSLGAFVTPPTKFNIPFLGEIELSKLSGLKLVGYLHEMKHSRESLVAKCKESFEAYNTVEFFLFMLPDNPRWMLLSPTVRHVNKLIREFCKTWPRIFRDPVIKLHFQQVVLKQLRQKTRLLRWLVNIGMVWTFHSQAQALMKGQQSEIHLFITSTNTKMWMLRVKKG